MRLLVPLALALALLLAWLALGDRADSRGPAVGEGAAPADGTVGSTPLEVASGAGDEATRLAARAGGAPVTGRVEDAASGEGLAGWRLVLWSEAGVHGDSTSDDAGAFAIPPAPALAGGAAFVAVDAPDGWEAEVARVPVARDARGAPRPVLVRGRPAAEAVLARRLVDAATGEPVPHFELELVRDGWGSMTAASDGAGALRSPGALPRGPLLARQIDHPLLDGDRHLPDLRLRNAGAGGDLTVEVGPTLRLELVAPPGVELAPDELVAAVRRVGEGPRASSLTWLAPVRTEGDEGPWVRLRPLELLFPFAARDDPSAFVLEVGDARRGLSGSALLPVLAGRHAAPVRVVLERVATLRARVVDESGAPVSDADAALTGAGGRAAPRQQRSAANGVLVFERVPPGAWTLRVFTRDHGVSLVRCALAPGESRTLEVRLRRVPIGRIAGTARAASETGETPFALLELRPLDGDSRELVFHEVLRAPEVGRVSTFDFGELPVGAYELTVLDSSGVWDRARRVVQAPDDGIELVLRDDLAPVTVEVPPDVELYVRATIDGRTITRYHRGPRFTLPTADPAAVDSWALLARDQRPVRGDGAQLGSRLGPDGIVTLERPQRPGWGRVVFVSERGVPLPGVAVRVDGVRVAATGPDGGVLVEAPAPPGAVSLDLPGHRVRAPLDTGFELRFEVERE